MKKRHIHVCLVSSQPIPNLTTVFQFKPDKIVLLYTNDMVAQNHRLEKVFKNRGFEVETREILPYDLDKVIAVSESVINDYTNDDVSLNITGGTKISTLGTFQSFYSADKLIHYVNTKDNTILQVTPTGNAMPIKVHIPIKEYLAAYGFVVDRRKGGSEEDSILARKPATEALSHVVISSESSIGALNAAFPDDVEKASYPFSLNIGDSSLQKISPILEKLGIIRDTHKGNWIILDVEKAKYLRGFWFEELVYLAAKSVGADEIQLNITGTWDVRGKKPPTNEFDVMIAKGNRLFYISCKSANPNRGIGAKVEDVVGKDYLYELDSLGDQALGLFGKKMLASARSITNSYLRDRARAMDIAIIDGKNIVTLKDNLRIWLNK